MTILFIIYGMGVVLSFFAGIALWWLSAEEGTHSYDYKIAKALIKYALVFPYAIVKVIKLLEQESKENDL